MVSLVGIALFQPSAKREGARLMPTGRADSRRMPRSGDPEFPELEPIDDGRLVRVLRDAPSQ
jgi:hypothetical protein